MPFRSAPPRIAAFLLTLALAACAAPPQSASPQPTARAPAKPRPPAAKPVPPQPVPPPQEAVPPAAPSQEAATVPPPPVMTVAPEKLKGLSEAQALALLGEPAGRAERPPARIWFYETAECRLELAFYLEVSGSGFHVLSHKAVPKGPTPLNGAACVDKVRNARK